MGRPSKPFSVIEGEGKSHRTAEEMRIRKAGEEAVLTGMKIREDDRVKTNPRAHEIFKRAIKLLEKIKKNDAIYENPINRYCIMSAECVDMEERIVGLRKRQQRLQERELEADSIQDEEERLKMIMNIERQLTQLDITINTTEGKLQTKRNSLLAIEKESCMTVAAALRSIPKAAPQKNERKLKGILSGSG